MLCFLLPLVKCLEDLLHEARFRDRAYDLDALVHHGFGDALHPVELRYINEFGDSTTSAVICSFSIAKERVRFSLKWVR